MAGVDIFTVFSSKLMSVQVEHSFQILEGHLAENSNTVHTCFLHF